MPCPCGSGEEYEACCSQYHLGTANAPTAEKLMRSRYSAFVKQEIAYLKKTTWTAQQKHFDEAGYRDRAANSIWLGLTIHATEDGLETDTRGTVTFTAKSMINGSIDDHTEKSLFKKKIGKWYYVKAVG
ncbi:MAG: YchJ family metal-binding protein [Rhizobiaceae bacterium]|nr:YchJ family metal-binding protein [Rhizobiaceae bacterium]